MHSSISQRLFIHISFNAHSNHWGRKEGFSERPRSNHVLTFQIQGCSSRIPLLDAHLQWEWTQEGRAFFFFNHFYWKDQRKLILPDDSEWESTALHKDQDMSAMKTHICVIPLVAGWVRVCCPIVLCALLLSHSGETSLKAFVRLLTAPHMWYDYFTILKFWNYLKLT